jgi:hypothetical protein
MQAGEGNGMALFPHGTTAVHARCNAGERKLFEALKRHLLDDHIVWNDLPIGDAGLQPDFVIRSPRQGLLVLEVKDWKRSTLAGTDKHRVQLSVERGLVSSAHPLAQARQLCWRSWTACSAMGRWLPAKAAFGGSCSFPRVGNARS